MVRKLWYENKGQFGDVKYFMKTFKTVTGTTPKEYKNILAQKQEEILDPTINLQNEL